ncbi:MAG TPA: helical backbone metal receptor [Polyangia bacterium]|nr:helical backbone metal receptor [Polyangia bacterium]
MRLVSLCPSLTDSLFALGCGAHVVGRTKFCVRPAEGVARVERVGGTKNPKIERIVALAPDLVLMNEEENRREDAETLEARGIRVSSTFARDIAGAASALVTIGDAVGAGAAARKWARDIEARAAEVRAAAAHRPRVRFVYLIWQEPWMAVAPGTYIDDLLTLAGGENVVTAREPRYPEVDRAQLAAADRVLLSSEPFPFAARHLQAASAATGLVPERFQLVDGELLSWHGTRTLAGLDYAASLFANAT